MKQRNLAPLAAALFAAMTMGACSDNDNKRSIGRTASARTAIKLRRT